MEIKIILLTVVVYMAMYYDLSMRHFGGIIYIFDFNIYIFPLHLTLYPLYSHLLYIVLS